MERGRVREIPKLFPTSRARPKRKVNLRFTRPSPEARNLANVTSLAPTRPRALSPRPEASRAAAAPHDLSLEARVAAAQNGDAGATEALLQQFRPLLRSRVHGLWIAVREELSTLEWADVEAQMTLMFLTRLHAFDASKGVFFPHYIERMLEWDARTWLRAQRRGQATPFSQLGALGEDGVELDDWMPADPTDQARDIERVLGLQTALDALPEAQRVVVWGCCVLGKTEARVAQELGLSRSAVRNRLEAALGKMRAFFGSTEEGTRTGRARPDGARAESIHPEHVREISGESAAAPANAKTARAPFQEFWSFISAMAKDEKRPDLVGVGAGRPVLLQGTFDFPATGIKTPDLLSRKMTYTVPKGCVAGVRYVRVGVVCEKMVVISTVVNGLPHRLIPVAANDTAHAPFAIVEPIVAGSQIEIWVASDAPGIAIVDIGVLQMPT